MLQPAPLQCSVPVSALIVCRVMPACVCRAEINPGLSKQEQNAALTSPFALSCGSTMRFTVPRRTRLRNSSSLACPDDTKAVGTQNVSFRNAAFVSRGQFTALMFRRIKGADAQNRFVKNRIFAGVPVIKEGLDVDDECQATPAVHENVFGAHLSSYGHL